MVVIASLQRISRYIILSTYCLSKVIYVPLPKSSEGPLWSGSYGSWIYNYLCNQCISPLTLCSNPAQARCIRYNIMWYSLSVTSYRSVVFSWYSCFFHEENWPPRYNWNILMKVALNTIALPPSKQNRNIVGNGISSCFTPLASSKLRQPI
jgi:hypothetical protein